MPYTLSHAVVAIPISIISRGKVPFASLAVGSLSPDFPYLLALTPTNAPGHSVNGVLIYCLLPSLIMLFAWYRLLEAPTLQLLGLPKRSWSLCLSSWFFILVGVLFGAYSHALWDATSHSYGAFVINSEFWNSEVLSLPLYKWNQYGGGVLGLSTLAVWYLYALVLNRKENYEGQLVTGILIYSVSIAFFVVLANLIHGSDVLSEYAVRSAIGIMVGVVCGMCLYTLVVYWQARGEFA